MTDQVAAISPRTEKLALTLGMAMVVGVGR